MKNVLTGVFLGTALLSSHAIAESSDIFASDNWYAGGGIIFGKSKHKQEFAGTSETNSESLKGLKLKAGLKLPKNYRAQLYFSGENSWNDNNIYGLGIEGIKAFDINSDMISPFIQIGLGWDWTSLEHDLINYSSSTYSALNYKLGAGLYMHMSKQLELEAGLDLQNRDWQDIKSNLPGTPGTQTNKDTSTVFYVGANWHF